ELKTAALNRIAAPITGPAILDRFKLQVCSQKNARPGNWIYFVPIAESCARAHAAAVSSAAPPPRPAPTMPPGYAEAAAARIGDGSLDSFRAVTGNPAATFEE